MVVESNSVIHAGDSAAARLHTAHPGLIIQPRRWIALGQNDFRFPNGISVPATNVIAAVLFEVMRRARGAGGAPTGLVLTHPQSWDPGRISILVGAARQIGFTPDRIRIIPEPAAVVHGHGRIASGSRLVVVDAGDDGVEVTVLVAAANGVLHTVTSQRDSQFGGAPVDASRIARFTAATIEQAGISGESELVTLYPAGELSATPSLRSLLAEIAPLTVSDEPESTAAVGAVVGPSTAANGSSTVDPPIAPDRQGTSGHPPRSAQRRPRRRAVTATAWVGAALTLLAVVAASAVYLSSHGKKEAIDDGTGRFQTIRVGMSDDYNEIAVDPTSGNIYVNNRHDNTVSVIDGRTRTVTATVSVSEGPVGIAIDPALHRVYSVGWGKSVPPENQKSLLSVIDTITNRVVTQIPTGLASRAVAVDPANHNVYVANTRSGDNQPNASSKLMVIDAQSLTVKSAVPIGYNASKIALDPQSRIAYIAGDYLEPSKATPTAGLVLVNLDTTTVSSNIALPNGAFDVAVDVTDKMVLATAKDVIYFIDTSTAGSVATVPNPGSLTEAVIVDQTKHLAYATRGTAENESIAVLDTSKRSVVDTIEIGADAACHGLASSGGSAAVYVACDFDKVLVLPGR
ncbi:hypothetical protein [Nocardia aurantia]|uniref:hypothetical protein n=1 Tax=Nocardia aurantia TaxID=2585199 RepID=UPI001297A094|nr:hypothetical protein [Nocardia aurantia]